MEHLRQFATSPTIAARGAHAATHCYLSQRRAIAATYHKIAGKFATTEVTPEMVC